MPNENKITTKPPRRLDPRQVQALVFKEIVDLLEDTSGLTLSNHFILFLRPANNNGKPVYDWTDEELLLVVQNYKKEIHDDPV